MRDRIHLIHKTFTIIMLETKKVLGFIDVEAKKYGVTKRYGLKK